MSKFITIYELLELTKDGKAPKLVKYGNYIWEYKEEFDDYFYDGEYLIENGFDSWNNIKAYLEEVVEIIEEDNKIEKITWLEKESMAGNLTEKQTIEVLKRRTEKLKKSFNNLIDEINKINSNLQK